LNRQFLEEEIQMTNKHMKKCLTSLALKEKQIQTVLRFHLMLVRKAIIKKTNNKCEAMEKKEPSYTVGGNVNWYTYYGNQHEDSSKN
jgi:hypothetical protein